MNELVGEDLPGCESSYETSIIMLEALLEPLPSDIIAHDSDASEKMDEEDRLTVEKCKTLAKIQLTNSHPKHQETSRRTPQEIGFRISTKFPDTIH